MRDGRLECSHFRQDDRRGKALWRPPPWVESETFCSRGTQRAVLAMGLGSGWGWRVVTTHPGLVVGQVFGVAGPAGR